LTRNASPTRFGKERLKRRRAGTDVGDLVARVPVRPGNSDLFRDLDGTLLELISYA